MEEVSLSLETRIGRKVYEWKWGDFLDSVSSPFGGSGEEWVGLGLLDIKTEKPSFSHSNNLFSLSLLPTFGHFGVYQTLPGLSFTKGNTRMRFSMYLSQKTKKKQCSECQVRDDRRNQCHQMTEPVQWSSLSFRGQSWWLHIHDENL